jgi:hypothetical protein
MTKTQSIYINCFNRRYLEKNLVMSNNGYDILTNISRRNDLRAQAQLPLLDVQTEYQRQMAILAQADYSVSQESHAATQSIVRRTPLVKHRDKHPTILSKAFGIWFIAARVKSLFNGK